MIRRDFLRNVFWSALLPIARPRGARARSEGGAGPHQLQYLTPAEYDYITKMSREVLPVEPVLSGRVDVAGNIDRFLATTRAEDMADMLHYLRLIRLAEPVVPVARAFMPGIDRDVMSLKKVVCFVGYYSDANGEAELPPAERVIWPTIGYGGPKPDDWWPAEEEPQIDVTQLEDRVGRVL
jgi:hypothetical protein